MACSNCARPTCLHFGVTVITGFIFANISPSSLVFFPMTIVFSYAVLFDLGLCLATSKRMLGSIAEARGLQRTAQKCSGEELPLAQGQGRQPRVPGCIITAAVERRYPTSEVRGGGQEQQPHIQGAVAARAQEGQEELLHVQGQEGWP